MTAPSRPGRRLWLRSNPGATVFVSHLTKGDASQRPAGYNPPMSETYVRIEVAGQHVASGTRLHSIPDNPIRMPLDPADQGSRAYLGAWALSKEERDVVLIDRLGSKRAIRAKVALYDDACFFYPSNTPVVSDRVLFQRDRYRVRQ
jgi:hypothetical protein